MCLGFKLESKWLLYPTATYKRFDSFRSIQTSHSKKFYFASLLKFYQIHNYRWQQASKIIFFRDMQSRNFWMHLFFKKQEFLNSVLDLKNFIKNKNFFLTKKSLIKNLIKIYF